MNVWAYWIPAAVYLLCFLTSTACAWLLLRSWIKARTQLLLWSAICFVMLACNNLLLIVDLLVVRDVDLSVYRLLASLIGVGLLLFGFVWRSDEA